MTPDQLINIYTISIAIIAPVSGATIWLVSREKVRCEIAKQKSITEQAIAKEKSVGAQAVYDVMNQMTKMKQDIDRLNEMDEIKTDELRTLEEDYKKLTLMIIELLKLK